jgi:membrane-associated phospholipid phosphatase
MARLDWRIFHAINEFAQDDKWLAHATYVFETLGVVLYAAAVVVLWMATRPGEERRWKIAALSGAASAGLALLINQIIAHVWHRPRPYESHTHVYHLTKSHDPSFPSDHASAAFGIAFGIYFIDRRVGRLFLVVAALIGAGRLLVGAHYVTDVLASIVVAAFAAWLVTRFGGPLLRRVVGLLERATDPLVAPFHHRLRRQT